MKKTAVYLIALLLLAGLCSCSKPTSNTTTVPAPTAESEGSAEPVAPAEPITVEMTVKDYGTVRMEVYPDIAPKTVENFVALVKDGFYDGKTFHRIINGFMIQGGADPEGKVANIPGEFEANGFKNDLKHTEGVLSMARANHPDSASSQFFIMVGEAPWLDGQYAAFGKVTEGMDIVLQIAEDARPTDDNGTIAPEQQPVIESITIVE
ncbi:MAG: peptidylprolyl isomerase [Erysipelotrichaceae bacterium]|nr:peptidylprolyl isomerase [Erysipelotrichaceae bacterium]